VTFARGTSVVWRSRPHGHVGYTLPAIVVQDDADAIVLYQPPGTTCMRRRGRRGGPGGRNLLPDGASGGYEEVVWPGPGVIRHYIPGSSHAVLRYWREPGEITGWYVNLETPWTRTGIGFDTQDLILDLFVDDDLSWRWKDEDELAWAVEVGKFSSELADAARAAGERAIEALEARAWPFDADWARWAPEPSWPVPVLPEGWDDPGG
jgi:hypothetical protein